MSDRRKGSKTFGINPRTENNYVPIFATWNAFSLILSVSDVNCRPVACSVMFLFTAVIDSLNAFCIILSPSNNPPAIRFRRYAGWIIVTVPCSRAVFALARSAAELTDPNSSGKAQNVGHKCNSDV